MLATLTRAPSVFSPRRDLARARSSAPAWCWTRWWRRAPSPKEQAADARAHPAMVIDRTSVDARNYFLDTAADQAKQLAAQARSPMPT